MSTSIKYVGDFEAVSIGQDTVAQGGIIEVDAAVAKELLKRDDFERPTKAAAAAAAKKISEASASVETSEASAADNLPQEG